MPAEAYDDAGSFDRGSSSPCSLFSRFRAPSRGTGSNRLLRSGLAALAILALTGTGSVALADTLNFQADLVGRQEVPPNDSTATGHVEATLDTSANTLTWTVVYSGLSGAPIGAHFHGPVSYVGATS
ncbi:MAG: CHRD domain-containing protein, partial [Roseiarcus sp.]